MLANKASQLCKIKDRMLQNSEILNDSFGKSTSNCEFYQQIAINVIILQH